ncbi:hypothetical protein CEN50_22840 [Fischerella thermalis CCMEE 5268]|uniref:Uncharacterized protein n=1 Tax=Fischerella thermalis CCMEE 5268 TaxID=2019662 RepID=A0A2N6KAG8_9CYAN|nr:hypothetical protein [Fischerella thermalis]PLZ95297.1 hypothetical protein CEN50_22840 [Fischerella thermalis CCMEE 5268]
MANLTKVEGQNPVGSDGPGGHEIDVKKYITWQVKSTRHQFTAPKDKYNDLKDVLGLIDVETNDAQKEKGLKLAQGQGFVYLSVKVKGGGNLKVVCDPEKIGSALKEAVKKKIYGKDIDNIRIPKRRIYV